METAHLITQDHGVDYISLATPPEGMGLTGCWSVIAVDRTTIELALPKLQQKPETEIAY